MKFIKDNKEGQNFIKKLLKMFGRNPHVAVGIVQEKPEKENFLMSDLAAVHEYGSVVKRIPARSFIRSTCDAKQKDHIQLIKKLEDKVRRKKLTIREALTTLGEVISKDMVQAINQGIPPALKKETIFKKKSSKPLIDTGQLKGSITHETRGL